MVNTELLYIRTSDDLRLNGVFYKPNKRAKNLCVLMIHGMSGNILENYFAHVMGEKLAENNIGFLYSHNRGYNHINDIVTSKVKKSGGYESRRIGATYERFTECLFDIDAWIAKVRKLGYKKIILAGHSLGCNKLIYYFHSRKPKDVAGVILLSPPDMVGLFEKPEYNPEHEKLLDAAKENLKKGKPGELVPGMIWDWYYLSSQTYVDQTTHNAPGDNLPILRKPERFVQLESINVPLLGVMGEFDDIVIKSLQEDMDSIATKAVNTPSFAKKFIKGASHTYDTKEIELANTVFDWIKTLKK